MALFRAFFPETLVDCTVSPLAETLTSHLAFDPFPLVLPTLSSAYKETYALLEPIDVVTFIEISVFPFPDTSTVREPILEFSKIDLSLA